MLTHARLAGGERNKLERTSFSRRPPNLLRAPRPTAGVTETRPFETIWSAAETDIRDGALPYRDHLGDIRETARPIFQFHDLTAWKYPSFAFQRYRLRPFMQRVTEFNYRFSVLAKLY
jgi:hypothetical protein